MQSSIEPISTSPVALARCRSCGEKVSGNFCAACGEAVRLHVPSAVEFLHEFVGHFVALEGKLWKTLQLLILRPGQLTLEFLGGRRVPFIAPLRLYLTLSLVFFALIKFFSVELPYVALDNDAIGVTYSHSVPSQTEPGKTQMATMNFTVHEKKSPGAQITRGQSARPDLSDDIRNSLAMVGRINLKWMHNLQEFISETDEKKGAILNHGFLAYLPYMLIGALPLFALYLKLIYRDAGRRYGEHLVFALYTNSFAFLLAALMILTPGSIGWAVFGTMMGQSTYISAWDYLQLVPFVCLVAYLPIALRRVYGGSHLANGVRWLALMSAHLFVIGLATIIAELIGMVGHA